MDLKNINIPQKFLHKHTNTDQRSHKCSLYNRTHSQKPELTKAQYAMPRGPKKLSPNYKNS